MQLHHIDVTDRYLPVELVHPSVRRMQGHLSGRFESRPACSSNSTISSSCAPSKTGVAIGTPRPKVPGKLENLRIFHRSAMSSHRTSPCRRVSFIRCGDGTSCPRLASRLIQHIADFACRARQTPSRDGFRESDRRSYGDGTPSGLSTISTLVPSSRYGMSSRGAILEMTPLLP